MTTPQKEKLAASPRLRFIQRTAIVIMLVGGVVNFVDRVTLAVANPLIHDDLNVSVGEMGILLSAFLWSYAVAQLPAGVLVDRFGARKMLGFGLVVWSIAQMLGGAVTSFGQFIATRVLLGIGESPQFPSAARVSRDWFNVRERAFPLSIVNSSPYIAQTIALPILTIIMLSLGWRWMFVATGALGVVVAVVWFAMFRDRKGVALTPNEEEHLDDGDVAAVITPATSAEWRQLFRFRSVWGLILGCFGIGYVSWLYGTWLPGYLHMQRHMTISSTGWVAAIPHAFAIVGALLGGWIADRLAKRGFSPVNSRKIPLIIGITGAALFTIFAAYAKSDVLAMVFITIAVASGSMCGGLYWALAGVIAPSNLAGSCGAIANFGYYVGGAIVPIATGFIVQSTGSFTPALLMSGAIGLVSSLCYVLLIKNEPLLFKTPRHENVTIAAQG
ncbi:MFS transporter [Paraburkholderia sp. RL17-337-BIB-A]|uniref:MFS transporter n=1 Tax=Paraburkholderia sp. RL17-337-BIB-A TaxID=3031636 RepID=UPI0038B95F6C